MEKKEIDAELLKRFVISLRDSFSTDEYIKSHTNVDNKYDKIVQIIVGKQAETAQSVCNDIIKYIDHHTTH